MYQALYRKWRPRSFDEVVGQEHITETLKRQIESGRLSHAYLFVGTRGTGKTSCAKILSRAVNCEHPVNGSPCNECVSCRGIENGSILDVEELDAASNNGVDSVRALREEAIFTPATVKKRVYIVDEVHMLTNAAFNALLKILEEPPQHLIFILATTEIQKVPATILSRCQRFSFRRIAPEDISLRLKYVACQEQLVLSDDAADLLSRLADGSMRDALSLLDQCSATENIDVSVVLSSIGLAGSAETEALLNAVCNGDTSKALEIVDKLYSGGRDMSSVLSELMSLTRDVLLTKLMPKGSSGLLSGTFAKKVLQAFSAKFLPERLISSIQLMKNGLQDMSRLSNRKLAVELCVIRMCDESLSGDITGLISRVSALEQKLKQFENGAVFTAAVPPTDSLSESDTPFDFDEEYAFPSEEAAPPFDIDEPPFDVEPPAKAPSPVSITASNSDTHTPTVVMPSKNISQDSDTNWSQILAAIKPKASMPLFSFLGDSSHATAEIDGDSITIIAKNPIALQMLNTPQVISLVKDCAENVLGKAFAVKVTEGSVTPKIYGDKLDELSKFGNITFE